MEEEMEELCAEGLATRSDPESCVASREGRGEALTGARIGQAMEPRNVAIGVPTLFKRWKATLLAALARAAAGPARSENQGMCGTSMRENRESLSPPVWLVTRTGRPGNAEAVILG